MSKLVDYAKQELDAIGMTSDGDQYNAALREDILRLVEVFAEQGHSGSSAAYAIGCLEKILRFEPLGPLTGDDSEWVKLEYTDDTYYQNLRCSHVFKNVDGKAYDIDGKIFWEWYTDEDGVKRKSYYTSGDSRVYIEFPYTPKSEYVYRESEAER